MPAVPHTRHRDKMHLIWVKLRCKGWTATSIARHFKVTPDQVRTATKRIRADDLAMSGEPADLVEKSYAFIEAGKAGK